MTLPRLHASALRRIRRDYAAVSMIVRVHAPTEKWTTLATGNYPYTEDAAIRRACVREVAARAWLVDHEEDEASDLEVSPLRTSKRSPNLVSVVSTFDIANLLNEEDDDIFAWASVEMLGHNDWKRGEVEGLDTREESLLHAFRLGREQLEKAVRNLQPEDADEGADWRLHVERIAAELKAHRASVAA